MILQTLWVISILLATWYVFEGVRLDRTLMRFIGFLAVVIGVLHGAHELVRLADLMQGRYVEDPKMGLEIILPFGLAVRKYAPLVVRVHG